MRYILLLIACASTLVIAQAPSDDVTFTDNVRQFVMRGDDTDKIDVSLTLGTNSLTMTPKKRGSAVLTIPYTTITGVTYDRRSRVRKMFVGTQGVSKAEDHFLTVQYKPEAGAGGFIEIEMGKDTAPRLLATLEARSGKTITRSAGS